jgi:hypothetical protein
MSYQGPFWTDGPERQATSRILLVRKHVTLRNLDHDRIMEEEIDATIDRGLDRFMAMPLAVSVRLVSAFPVFRSDGVTFVTIIADVEVENP